MNIVNKMSARKKYCGIPGCENNMGTSDPNIHFYRSPTMANMELRFKWMEAIKRLFGIDIKDRTISLCSLHFEAKFFFSKNRLKTGTVPTIGFSSNSTVKIEPMETVEEYPIQHININGIKEQPKDENRIDNMYLQSEQMERIENLPEVKPSHCLQCTDNSIKLRLANQKNEKIVEKFKELLKENRRLKAHIKYLNEKDLDTSIPMERECCEICNNELAPDRFQTHLCVDLNEITCEYCTSSFKSTIELCEHLKVAKHTEVIYECDKCPMIFSTATLLTFHQTSKLTHTEIIPDFQNSKSETETINIDMDVSLADKIFACAICNSSFKTGRELLEHRKKSHRFPYVYCENEPDIEKAVTEKNVTGKRRRRVQCKNFECYICKIEFLSKVNVRNHLKLHTAARDIKCVICQENFTSNELDYHMCSTEKSILCDYCDISFNATVKLLQHLESAHDDRTIYKCRKSNCFQFFGMITLRTWHENQHKDQPKPFGCDKCGKTFHDKARLSGHLQRHDTQIRFLCPECGKGCRTVQQMKTHQLVHSEKTMKCPDCPMMFNNLQIFRDHRELHMNLKYKCNECSSTFACKRYLWTHIRRKHRKINPMKKITCVQCPLKFANANKLSLHMLKHTGEKPFACDFCGKKYAYKQDLAKHLSIHVGNNIYQCDLCEQGFRLASELRRHRYKHYKKEEETEPQENADN